MTTHDSQPDGLSPTQGRSLVLAVATGWGVRLFGVENGAGKIMHNVQNKSCARLHNVHSSEHRRQ